MKKIVFGLFFLLAWDSSLHAQTPFYQGKTITLITGTTAESQYDAHARLIAQHWIASRDTRRTAQNAT
jgi:YD repeat-containing protein